jgi:hypothetical protein
VAAPSSIADPQQDTGKAAAAAEPRPLLDTPEVPRVSDGPYAGFQFCGDPQNTPLVTSDSPTLAATLEAVAPPGSTEPPQDSYRPGHMVVFEVNYADGRPLLTKQATSEVSHDALFQVPAGKLPNGDYRWRVKVHDGAAVSSWTAWCDFTVRLAS